MNIPSYHNDTKIKFLHSEQQNNEINALNAVGATTSTTLRSLDFTPADDNSIFVSKTGLDTNTGTQAAPVLTIARAISLCNATHTHVVIMDSGEYRESLLTIAVNIGLHAAIGQAPKLVMKPDCLPMVSNASMWDTTLCSHSASVTLSYTMLELSNGNYLILYSTYNSSTLAYVLYACLLDSNFTVLNQQQIWTATFASGTTAVQIMGSVEANNAIYVVLRRVATVTDSRVLKLTITGTFTSISSYVHTSFGGAIIGLSTIFSLGNGLWGYEYGSGYLYVYNDLSFHFMKNLNGYLNQYQYGCIVVHSGLVKSVCDYDGNTLSSGSVTNTWKVNCRYIHKRADGSAWGVSYTNASGLFVATEDMELIASRDIVSDGGLEPRSRIHIINDDLVLAQLTDTLVALYYFDGSTILFRFTQTRIFTG